MLRLKKWVWATTISWPLFGLAVGQTEKGLGLLQGQAGPDVPPGWAAQFHPDIPEHTEISRTSHTDELVLRIRSHAGYGSWVYTFDQPAEVAALSWRWRVLRKPDGADLKIKAGDDAAIKLCLFVAIDESRLGLGTRLALGAARTLSGENLPAATLCYVWSSNPYKGEMFANPYTDRVRNWVLRDEPSGDIWRFEQRDIRTDVINAFSNELPLIGGQPQVKLLGLAIGGDADNTQSQSSAEFKAFVVERR